MHCHHYPALKKKHLRLLYQLPQNTRQSIFVVVICFPPFQDKNILHTSLQNPEWEREKCQNYWSTECIIPFLCFPLEKFSLSIQWLPWRFATASRFSPEQKQGMVKKTQMCLMLSDVEVLCTQLHCCCAMVQKNWKPSAQGIGYEINNCLLLLWCQTENKHKPLSGSLKITK